MLILRHADRVVLARFAARVGVTVLVFFGLMVLVESLNTSRFGAMQAVGGLPLAVLAMIVPAARWSIGTMPITVLIGTIAAVLDLQSRHELTILKVSGMSIWRILRWPVLALFLVSGAISLFGETWAITMDRGFPESGRKLSGPLWIEQTGDAPYILYANRISASSPQLREVTVFFTQATGRERIVAESASYRRGTWTLRNGTSFKVDAPAAPFETREIATRMTAGDLQLQLSLARDLTLPELLGAAATDISDPELRAVSLTSLYRAFSLPILVVGSILLAFALAGSYRRRGNYANALLVGVIVGFVLFVINELAIRAGNAQVIPPIAATIGPAVLSLLTGATALLFREDGTL
jgi:lipopolysaccharide export system permease protein